MLDATFVSLFDSLTSLTLGDVLTSIFSALVMGVVIALCFRFRNPGTRSYTVTLALLPAIVAVVIIMVGGNLGTGVAVAGTFSLVRFRSMPGSAKEITAIFLAVAAGLACGIGYPLVGGILTVIVCAANIALTALNFGGRRNEALRKHLKIILPEDLDYAGMFNDIFEKYTSEAKLISVRTTNLGSLNKLHYEVVLKKENTEKEIIDLIRCRNGNLEISISAAELNVKDL